MMGEFGFDDYDEDQEDFDHYKEVTCKRCGKRGFIWSETVHGFRLVDRDGEIHNCLSNVASAEEFPDL